jgi:hypothetical protein
LPETATIRRALLPPLAEATAGLVVCLATGPSLTQADVDLVRGRATVVCVNDAHRLAPWGHVLYSSDRYWWNHYRGVASFAGHKAGIEYSKGRAPVELLKRSPGMVFYRNTGHDGLEIVPDGLRTCGQNSGGAALNLAVHLGATRVILLGYDMGDVTGKQHFFGRHPQVIASRHNFPRWRKAFDSMAAPLKSAGVEVVNATRTTSLSAFPVVPLEAAL